MTLRTRAAGKANVAAIIYNNVTEDVSGNEVRDSDTDLWDSAIIQQPWEDVASGSTCAIGAATSNFVRVTGTTNITAFDNVAAGIYRKLKFAGALIIAHNATTLILPGAANITTAAGDIAEVISEGSGNWRITDYVRASGLPIAGGGGTFPPSSVNNDIAGFSGTSGTVLQSLGSIANVLLGLLTTRGDIIVRGVSQVTRKALGSSGQYLGSDGTDVIWKAVSVSEVAGAAPLADPSFTGNPTVPTQAVGNNSTRAASTAFVQSMLGVQPVRLEKIVVSSLTSLITFALIDDTLYRAFVLKIYNAVLEDNGSEMYVEPYIGGSYNSGATFVINHRRSVLGSYDTTAINSGGPGFSLNHPARDQFLNPYTIDGEVFCPNPFSTANFKQIHCEAYFVSEDVTGMYDGGFDAGAGAWTADAGWTFSGGKANHNGATGGIYRTLTLVNGVTYDISWDQAQTVAGGGVTPVLLVGTTHTGTASTTAGRKTQQLTATSGNTTFAFSAASSWVGSVDNVRITPVNDPAKPTGFNSVSRALVRIESLGKFNRLSVCSALPGVGLRGLKAGTFELWAYPI